MDGKKTLLNHLTILKHDRKACVCMCVRENLHSYSDSSWKL